MLALNKLVTPRQLLKIQVIKKVLPDFFQLTKMPLCEQNLIRFHSVLPLDANKEKGPNHNFYRCNFPCTPIICK